MAKEIHSDGETSFSDVLPVWFYHPSMRKKGRYKRQYKLHDRMIVKSWTEHLAYSNNNFNININLEKTAQGCMISSREGKYTVFEAYRGRFKAIIRLL